MSPADADTDGLEAVGLVGLVGWVETKPGKKGFTGLEDEGKELDWEEVFFNILSGRRGGSIEAGFGAGAQYSCEKGSMDLSAPGSAILSAGPRIVS